MVIGGAESGTLEKCDWGVVLQSYRIVCGSRVEIKRNKILISLKPKFFDPNLGFFHKQSGACPCPYDKKDNAFARPSLFLTFYRFCIYYKLNLLQHANPPILCNEV